MAYVECFFDSARGIYIPQNFAEAIDPADWTGLDAEDLDVLRAGPDAEGYWDAWQSVLDYAETKDGAVLYQDGDLFLVYQDRAISDLNEYLAQVLEYETEHRDAGDAYAHTVPESVFMDNFKRALDEEVLLQGPGETALDAKWSPKYPVDFRGLDAEDVLRLALDLFEMVPGSIWGPYGDHGIPLAGFPVQEIETEVPRKFQDVLPYIGDGSTDAYIPDGGTLAYITTDAVWYACVPVQDLQDAIDAEVLDRAQA